jgi:hypothetical protein
MDPMRKFLISLVMGAVLLSCKQGVKGKNGVTYKSAVQYNDFIVERHSTLMKNVIQLGNLKDAEIDSAHVYLQRYTRQTEKMIREIKGMPAYKGDSTLRDAAIRSFGFYQRLFEEEYPLLMNIRKKGAANITEEDKAEGSRIVKRIVQEEEVYDKSFREAQENYARKNKMKLADNKLLEEVSKPGN